MHILYTDTMGDSADPHQTASQTDIGLPCLLRPLSEDVGKQRYGNIDFGITIPYTNKEIKA